MMFFVFMLLVYAMAFFHRFEHRAMIEDLRALLPLLPLGADIPPPHDWRQSGGTPDTPRLLRAFRPANGRARLRYALPVLFAAVMMIVLQTYVFAACYIAACAVKWFLLKPELTRSTQDAAKGSYALFIGSWRVMGEEI